MAIYVSIDIETTGKDPAQNAILSIGAHAVRIGGVGDPPGGKFLGQFSLNLQVPEHRVWDKDTRKWWDGQDEAAHRAFQVEPLSQIKPAMVMFLSWLHKSLGRRTINHGDATTPDMGWEPIHLVFYPASFDYRFLTHYVGKCIEPGTVLHNFWFNHQGTVVVDLQTMAMALLQVEGYQARRSSWPEVWRKGEEGFTKHTALGDACIQMNYFLNMREWARVNNPNAYTLKATTVAEEGK